MLLIDAPPSEPLAFFFFVRLWFWKQFQDFWSYKIIANLFPHSISTLLEEFTSLLFDSMNNGICNGRLFSPSRRVVLISKIFYQTHHELVSISLVVSSKYNIVGTWTSNHPIVGSTCIESAENFVQNTVICNLRTTASKMIATGFCTFWLDKILVFQSFASISYKTFIVPTQVIIKSKLVGLAIQW